MPFSLPLRRTQTLSNSGGQSYSHLESHTHQQPLRSPCRPGKHLHLKGPEALPAAFLSARRLLYLHLAHFMPFQACTHTLFLSCPYPLEVGGRKQKQGSRKERDPLSSPTAHTLRTQAALPREWKLGIFYLSSLTLKLEHNVFKMVTH